MWYTVPLIAREGDEPGPLAQAILELRSDLPPPLDRGGTPDSSSCSTSRSVLERRQQVVTGLLAAPTDPGADPAVLVVLGVTVALLGADAAGRRAGLHRRAKHADVALGLARRDAAGGVAQLGAVETETDAADHGLDVGLGQIGVRAGGAGGVAVGALLDAADERVAIAVGRMRMRVDDLSNGHVLSSRVLTSDNRSVVRVVRGPRASDSYGWRLESVQRPDDRPSTDSPTNGLFASAPALASADAALISARWVAWSTGALLVLAALVLAGRASAGRSTASSVWRLLAGAVGSGLLFSVLVLV